jgi:hypothetical protein
MAYQPNIIPLISTSNSSTTTLGISATFTGASEDISNYNNISVNVFSDVASATDGLSIQQSSNGTNWDVTDVFTIPAATGKTFSVGKLAKFFRVVYTNGGTAQATFRLQTIFSEGMPKGSSQRPQDGRGNDNDFEEMSAFLHGYNGSTWDRLRATTANGLAVDVTRVPAITKGTQGTTGITTQDLKDAGRNTRIFALDTYTAAPVAEAVQTVVQWYSNAAVAGTTQPAVVPTGKTLRLTHYTISTKSLATVGSVVVRIRANTAGLGVLASPLVFSMECGSRAGATTVAMTGGMDTFSGVFPEGLELPAGTGLAFSMAGYGPTGTLTLQGVTRFQVFGYEY